MEDEKKNQWHPAFYGALHLELADNKEDLEFIEEFILNTLPLRVDTLIIKKKRDCIIQNEIGKIFKTHNLVEYKSPEDKLNFDTFLNGIAYSYLYKSREKHVDDILLSDISLTFIRERKPKKLFKNLIKEKFTVEEYCPGIYYVSREGSIAIQIVVSSELDEKEHIWLNSLTSQLNQERASELIDATSELVDLDDKNYAESVWTIVTTLNKGLIKRMREDEDMNKVIAEIFKPEIDAAFNNGFNNGFNDGFDNGIDNKGIQVFKNMIKRGFSREEAQSLAEISDELVERALAE